MLLVNSINISFKKLFLFVFILLLIAGNIFLGYKYFILQKELREAEIILQSHEADEDILNFMNFFIAKVLKAETEVDFETRLKLETAVRDLEDQEILNQWQKFIDSQTEQEAQKEVKNLLEILVNKIKLR